MPKGGRRIGCGRKPSGALELVVKGSRRRRVPDTGEAVPAPVATVAVPGDLSVEERAVWLQLAPHACALRTLTPATALAFTLLVQNVVLERTLARSSPGSVNHRGTLRLLEGDLSAFCLRPFGRAIFEAAPPPGPNPLDQFLRPRPRP